MSQKEQSSECGSKPSSPLSRIHHWKHVKHNSEDILPDSLLQENQHSPHLNVIKEEVLTEDVINGQDSTCLATANGDINIPQLYHLPENSCVLRSDNSDDVSRIKDISPHQVNDRKLTEFTKVQQQMPLLNQKSSNSELVTTENNPDCTSDNKPIKQTLALIPATTSSDYLVADDNARAPQQTQYEPLKFTEAAHLEAKTMNHQETNMSELSNCPSHEISISEPMTPTKDCSQLVTSNSSCQNMKQHTQAVTSQHVEVNLQLEPLTTNQTSRGLSPIFLSETSPPKEVFLSPQSIPHVTLTKGPTISGPSYDPLGSRRFESAFYTVSKPHRYKDDADLRAPPPSYSECVMLLPPASVRQNVMPTSSMKIAQHLQGSAGRATLISVDDVHMCKLCSEMKPLGRGYTKLPDPITVGPPHISTTSALGSRSDVQLSLGDRRPDIVENDHQLLAFIACLFCWPVGLVAIYYSNMCQMLKAEGNHEQAQIYARHTFILSSLALCSGTAIYIIMFVYQKTI